jgi:hypothetical protein
MSGFHWHAKKVRFAANGIHEVRDVYKQRLGIASYGTPDPTRNGYASQIAYILRTGASWRGAIGRAEIIVRFTDPRLPPLLKAVPVASVSRKGDERDLDVPTPPRNCVVWSGPCPPAVSGRELRFVRRNWRPTRADDILVTFADTEAPDPGLPISEASKHAKNDLRSVRALVARGASVNGKDANGYSVLYLACAAGLGDTVRFLLANGARVNVRTLDGQTPLMIVSESGNSAVARLLLARGADVNARNKDGWTALRIAVRWSNGDIVSSLEKHKARLY